RRNRLGDRRSVPADSDRMSVSGLTTPAPPPAPSPAPPAAAAPSPSLARRGLRLLWMSVRAHPRPFVVSIAGSILFGAMAVAGSWVLGRVTDDVVVPGFREEGVSGTTVAAGAAALVGVAALRSL